MSVSYGQIFTGETDVAEYQYGSAGWPNAPSLAYVAQANSGSANIVVVGVKQNPVTGNNPIVSFNLYRGPSISGPWTLVENDPINPLLVVTHCFDSNPQNGAQWYTAAAVDTAAQVSIMATPLVYAPYAAVLTGKANMSAAVYGSYPLLGSDIFLDPITKEGVIGPNGDLLSVNGLNCLAQDLRIRILTDLGTLPMHQDFGTFKDIIGQGQSSPATQAQKLRTRVVDAVLRDARVLKVLSVQVNIAAADSWSIAMDVVAIGTEDPLRLNLTYPYYVSGSSALPIGPYTA
jgi:phage baseplate assembly protein W